MKTIEFLKFPARKLNTDQLHREIAQAMELPFNDVGLSICHGGTRTTIIDGQSKEEIIQPFISVHIPDSAKGDLIEGIIIAHAPTHDDHEAMNVRLEREEEEKLKNHPLFKRLEAKVEALENVPTIRAELDRAAEARSEVGRDK